MIASGPGAIDVLNVDRLHAWYGESHILHGMSFSLRRGEVVALLGRNGSGRTTTLRAIVGLIDKRQGSIQIGEGNTYKVFDLDNKLVKDVKNDFKIDPLNKMNPSQGLDALHIQNFFEGIKKGTPVAAEIVGGHQSTLLAQLGNIAIRSGETLNIDPTNGHIKGSKAAEKFWKREYQKGWEPTV